MQNCNVEQIAQDVADGVLTEDDGARKLMETIFTHKTLFGLYSLDEDQFLDFLIYEFPKFKAIFSHYDKKCGTFFSFLLGSIRSAFRTWKKRMVRNSLISKSFSASDELVYEESLNRYTLPEEALIMQERNDTVGEVCSPDDVTTTGPFHRNDGTISTRYKSPSIERRRIDCLRKKAMLILALKSSFYLDDSLVHKVSGATSCDEEELIAMRDRILKTLRSKISRRNACLRCRDNAFYFHRKYLLECNSLDSGTVWSEYIHQKYAKQTKTWREKNRRLSRKSYTLSATNCAVAKELGMSPRHIFYIIKQARQNMDIISLK